MDVKAFLTETEIAACIAEEATSNKERKLTPEQIEAIYTSGTNILVSASAGSGKTFVMVRRILDIISRGISIDRLFISTFTVKAAGELKERLEAGLTDMLKEAKSEEEMVYLSEQVALLSAADIGTMDAFTQKLVNQHGYLLGISPMFRIMAEKSEQDILKGQVFQDLFSDYMTGQSSQDFIKLVRNFSGNRKDSSAFRALVYDIYQFSQSTASPKQWLESCFLAANQTPLKEQLEVYLSEFLSPNVLDRAITDALAFFQHHYETVTQEFQKSYKYLDAVQEVIELLGHFDVLSSREQVAAFLDKISALSSQLTMRIGNVKDEELKVFSKEYNQARPDYLAPFLEAKRALFEADVIERYQPESLPLLVLLRDFVSDFSDQYLQAKIQENAFEFNDIAHLAIQLLEDFPQVAHAYREHFHEVMVDEYQDNSHTQERLLELLSNGHNRFMVGDIKQSIYRFRQADPQIFHQQFKRFQDHPSAGKLILLKENFRSHAVVLEATNDLFRHLMDEDLGDIRYDETHLLVAGSAHQQEACPENKTQLLIYNTDTADDLPVDESEEAFETEDEPLSKGEINLVIKEIIRLYNDEKVAFKDMTLLVRSRSLYKDILPAFEAHGIPLVTDGGQMNYLKSLEVMVMLDTLRAINNPLNDYALVALLRSPMFQFDEDDLARIAIQADSGEFYDKLVLAHETSGDNSSLITNRLANKLANFMETFLTWRELAKRLSLYDLIWTIYNDRFYYDYVAALPKSEQRQANLYALALRAHAYEKTGFKGLPRFIGMIDKVLASDNDLADVDIVPPKNAVQVMTMHKSKGLEFQYVFILGADKELLTKLSDSRKPYILSRDKGIGIKYLADAKEDFPETRLPKVQLQIDTLPYRANQAESKKAELSELMRLLYVGMTRAEKRLYIVGKGSQEKLSQAYSGKSDKGLVPIKEREKQKNFQDWFLAVAEAFGKKGLAFEITYVNQDQLRADKIGRLTVEKGISADDLSQNRQSDQISQALAVLESVEELNQKYRSAINLPTVRTPSQVKHFYEQVMDTEGVEVMEKASAVVQKCQLSFSLPDFSNQTQPSATAIGAALHELMQRLQLSDQVTEAMVQKAIEAVQADPSVKAQLDLSKILAFFDSPFGKEILANRDKLHREAPFAMLTTDQESGEDFVVRGIIDGYLLYEDHLVLFDYKTDKFTDSQKIASRYQGQMALYAQALSQSYHIPKVDKYLVLLGGQKVEVLKLN